MLRPSGTILPRRNKMHSSYTHGPFRASYLDGHEEAQPLRLRHPIELRIVFSLACSFSSATHYSTVIPTGYIGEFEIIDDHRAGKIVIELTGRLNKCGVISPRFDVTQDEIEKWIVNLLPSRQFGHIVLTTSMGIMTHEEARRKKTGGKILGFFY